MAPPSTRKTRIVCISDTHNQTPKLPAGDVLIHAGDLTNQGSYSELKKTMQWLEKTDFEVKIVVAGNHDLTLDEPFFREHEGKWKWPEPQNASECRKLVTEARGITYLEHEAVTVKLKSGAQFRVFGSPFSPGRRGWAFQYQEPEAEGLWSAIPHDANIVVTHTPPRGHCDTSTNDDAAAGCAALLQRLAEVQPLLSVCGHIHEGRGVQHVYWGRGATVQWEDPGAGNKKLSLVDMTGRKAGRQAATRHSESGVVASIEGAQPDAANLNPTSSLTDCALGQSEADGPGCHLQARLDCGGGDDDAETAVVNAAILGPKSGRSNGINKPIVVDVELPIDG